MDAKTLADGFDYDSPKHLLADIKRKREIRNLENDFMLFIKGAWHIVEPNAEYSSNWTTEAIGLHLEATLDGTIRNLLINISPRFSKSLICNVFFPAWVWTTRPHMQFLFSSFAENLAIRDSIKCRAVVESDWYRSRWPNVTIRRDQNTKKEWVLNQGGHRITTSVGSSGTGKGADILLCVPKGQLISTSAGHLPIDKIVEDRLPVLIKSYNHATEATEYKEITEYMTNPMDDLLEFNVGEGKTFQCTVGHPVYAVGKGYVRADEVIEGDELLVDVRCKMQKRTVKGIQRISSKEPSTYNLTVADNNNYFINDVLTHNCDDGNDAKHARSPSKLEDTQYWWDNTMSTRLSNPKTGVKIIIQQRIAEGDLTGHVVKQGGYEHLIIPMRYEPDNTKVTSIGWEDPRKEEGELAWPERFGEKEVDELKLRLGSDGYAGQLQQRPAPKGGTIVKKTWIGRYKALPKLDRKALSVDCAFKDGEKNDYVVLGLWGMIGANKYLIHLVRAKLDIIATIAEIRDIHSRFSGINYTLIEDKANGTAIISMIKDKINGVIAFNPGRDSKIARLNAVAPQIEAGNVWVPDKYYEPNRERFPWCTEVLDACLDELFAFPKFNSDDFVDMLSQILLKENEGGNWFDDMLKEVDDDITPEEKEAKALAEMMGWNLT